MYACFEQRVVARQSRRRCSKGHPGQPATGARSRPLDCSCLKVDHFVQSSFKKNETIWAKKQKVLWTGVDQNIAHVLLLFFHCFQLLKIGNDAHQVIQFVDLDS